jgi:hypothetical protein
VDMVESFGDALYKTSDEMQSKCLRPSEIVDSTFIGPGSSPGVADSELPASSPL